MRSPRFLHLGFSYNPAVSIEELDVVVGSEALDFVRYAYNLYILWSPSDTETIVRKILRVNNMLGANVFVAEVVMLDSFGSLPPWVWSWITRCAPGLVQYPPPELNLPAPR